MSKENLNPINTMDSNTIARKIPAFVLEKAWFCTYIWVNFLTQCNFSYCCSLEELQNSYSVYANWVYVREI